MRRLTGPRKQASYYLDTVAARSMPQKLSTIIVREFPEPEIEAAWRKGLTRVKLVAHYNSPEFFREPFWEGKRPFAVLACNGKDVVGVLTGLHEGDEIACGQPARPQICIAEDEDPVSAVAALARGLLEEAGSSKLVTVFSWVALEGIERFGFKSRQLEGDVMLDLSLGPDTLFKHFDENRRRNIRSAMRNGVEVFPLTTSQHVREYYNVYREWRHTPRKKIVWEEVSFDVFEQALTLDASRKVFLAKHAGKIIAGITLRMYPGGLLEYAAGHAIEEYVRLRPNDLLHWRAIEWAYTQGFRAYCLGGAHPFLRKFGGNVTVIYRYRLDRTFLRREDLREALNDWGRRSLRRLPKPVEKVVRRSLGKS